MRILLIIGILFFTVTGWSQNIAFERITTREGLSQNDVNAIYQDRNGFLWIGTNDGLNRYDGYTFKTYQVDRKVKNSINSNLIFKIAEDNDGNIWMGTSDEGVCRFDVKTDKFYTIKNTPENSGLLSSNHILQLLPLKSGAVWVGTNQGIDILNLKNGVLSVQKINPENTPEIRTSNISVMKEDLYGRVWVGTRNGILIFSENRLLKRLKTVPGNSYVKDLFLADNEVMVLYGNGVFQLKIDWETLETLSYKKISNASANTILRSSRGDVFIGSNAGLYYLEREQPNRDEFKPEVLYTSNLEPTSLSKNRINCLFEDKSGIIWIGTFGGGLNKYNPKQKKFRHFKRSRLPGSLSNNKIRAIYEDRQKNIWIGTEGGGINFLPAGNNNFESGFINVNVNTSSNQNYAYSIIDINNSGKPKILIGAGYPSVINMFTVENKTPKEIDKGIFRGVLNSPFTLLKDRNNNIWLGTYGLNGLYKYYTDSTGEHLLNIKAGSSRTDLSSNTIRSLFEDNRGNIWLGTDNGLNLLVPEQQNQEHPKFKVFNTHGDDPHCISNDYILPIFQSSDSTLWIGTMGGGLNKLLYNDNPDSIKFETIDIYDGLPNNVIKAILEDDYGFLWLSSNKGLTRYNPEDKLVVNYDISDGLQDNEFGELAACKLSDGKMIFGGVNGINTFYPKDILSDMSTPKLVFTEFHILNQKISAGQKINGRVVLENGINYTKRIKLKYSENSFAIYFSSLHFSAPGKNMYKYKLEGFDKEWIRKDASDRIAKYTNIRPGRYTFKVLASNNDGIWTDDPRFLQIIITPPWYLSTVAWLIYVVLFLISLWFFQRYSLIRIKQKNELLMEHFEKEKVQELSQMKLRFFTNISHEFRTPLTLIIGPLEKLIQQGHSLSEKKIAESYAIMHRNASILLRLINQLVDFRKFEQGKMKLYASESNIITFLNEVFLSFAELAENKNITYNFNTSRDDIKIWFDDDKLERIMYNLLSNAFKFTPQNGQIDLIVDEDDYDVIIQVSDNGVGIPVENQKHIFERFYQAEKIKNRKVGSTGIGLSFIKGLVEMHKGEITFESEENVGTTFTVRLKKGDAHLQEDQLKDVNPEMAKETQNFNFLEPVSVDDSGEETNKLKYTVLIVEDNFELRKFIKDSLSVTYNIYEAENGKEGLEKISAINPDVIVSDIMMPVMNGFKLCEEIKSNESISHIPVVLLTAKSTAENRIKGYKLGADGYLAKPFNMEVLEARVQNLIQSREKLRQILRTTFNVEPSEVTTTSMDEKFLKKIMRIIEENIPNSEFTVEKLASDYGMSQIVLNKKLKGLTGQTAKAFIRTIRLKRAAQLFATGKYSVTDVTYEVGFSDLKYFRTCFKDEFGASPSEYIKKHKAG